MDQFEVLDLISWTADLPVDELTCISGGLSDALKYKAVLAGHPWMVKVTTGSALRYAWYCELAKLNSKQLAVPVFHSRNESGSLCLISPWVEGESLEACLGASTPGQIRAYGAQAAGLLRRLHSAEIPDLDYTMRLVQRVESVCNDVEQLGLSFPQSQECCEFLRRTIKGYQADRVCLVHRDVRAENFVVRDGTLYLIDFDNGGLGEASSDFSYLTTMGPTDQRSFAKALIHTYLDGKENSKFWRKNLLYSTLHVLEYAIWKFQTSGKQVQRQAENLLWQYNCFIQMLPRWWEDT